jgi:biopolymer transport protein ExbD
MASVNSEPDNELDLGALVAAAAPEEGPHKKKRQPPHKREITLNLVAMLDMSFNLLFFFVLSANFAAAEGVLSANLPAGDSNASDPNTPPPIARLLLNIKVRNISPTATAITLEVDGGSSKEVRDCAAMTHELLQRQGRDDDGKPISGATATMAKDDPVRIAPDSDVAWQDVVAVFNGTMRAGLTSVGFAPAGQ